MARRVYVRNPHVKGGGYWRNMQISQEGQVVGSGRRRRVKGTPAEEAARGARNARMQGRYKQPKIVKDHVPLKGTMLKSGGTRLSPFRKGDTVVVTGRRMTGGQTKSDFGGDLVEVRKGKVRGYVHPDRVTRVGDKQPRSTKPPKSRKPKKKGPLTGKASGQNFKKDVHGNRSVSKADRKALRDNFKRRGSATGGKKATKSTVKKAQGKKRTLSEAQKAAKRSRAKARRARK